MAIATVIALMAHEADLFILFGLPLVPCTETGCMIELHPDKGIVSSFMAISTDGRVLSQAGISRVPGHQSRRSP